MSTTSTQGDTELVTLGEAAEKLGVHYMTAYRYVRTGRMIAEKVGGKWWVTPAELAAVLEVGTGIRRAVVRPDGTPRELLVEPLAARLIVGDTAGCWDLITDALSGGATPVEVHQQLLQVAMSNIGYQWSIGELSIADEHRATATAYRLLGQLGPMFRHAGRRRGTVIVGATAGDAHGLPSAMLSDILSARRFEVIDLGANTPTESFLDAASKVDNLVGIGLCAMFDQLVPDLYVQAAELRQALPETCLVVGGPALQGADTTQLETVADYISSTAVDVCEAFEAAQNERQATK